MQVELHGALESIEIVVANILLPFRFPGRCFAIQCTGALSANARKKAMNTMKSAVPAERRNAKLNSNTITITNTRSMV